MAWRANQEGAGRSSHKKSGPSPRCRLSKPVEKALGIKKIPRTPRIRGVLRPKLWELARPRKSTRARSDIARPAQDSYLENLPKIMMVSL
jgi:hypothetical protein